MQHLQYLPFGEVFIDERKGSWHTPFTFSAKEQDEETGLHYFSARYYDSRTSTWLSVDPLCEKYYWISPYAYCLNNPVKYIDPDGKQVFLGANMPFSPLLGVSDPILLSNKPVATETVARIGRATTETVSKTSEATSKGAEISSKGNRTFGGRQSTESNTSKEAFGKAKDANGIPRSQQPDKTIKPNTPEGKEVGLDNRNIKQYEYTNSKGEKITIRQDKPAQYGDPSGKGNQSEHFNAGKSNENLSKQHHYYLWENVTK